MQQSPFPLSHHRFGFHVNQIIDIVTCREKDACEQRITVSRDSENSDYPLKYVHVYLQQNDAGATFCHALN